MFEHARMDLVFDPKGTTASLGVAIVTPFSASPALIAAASTRPGHMAKRAGGRPGYHAKKFVSNLMKDADNPSLAIRDTRSAVQSVLHSAAAPHRLCLPSLAFFA